MSKFIIECPVCGSYAEGKTGFFARKKIDCACGNTINVKTDKMTTRECPHCGNTVLYDQTKGTDAKCPVCHNRLVTQESMSALAEFSCPSCSCKITADKNAATYTCPLCDTVIDVQKQIAAESAKGQGLASLIKYEGGNDVFVWKHPLEDFNLGSQLIVHESQEAIFFKDGKALDLFGAGRYTLTTQNLPLLQELYKLPTNADTVFHSEIYYINKTVQMAIKWGTPDRVRFIDPLTGTPLDIGASGEMNLKVSDARKLLIKLVGTQKGIAWDDKDSSTMSLKSLFRPLIINAVKTSLPAAIKSQQIDILEIDERADEISAALLEKIQPGFEEYGLNIAQFYVTSFSLPENDPNFKRIRDLHTVTLQAQTYQAEATVKMAQAQSETAYRTAQEASKAEIAAAERKTALEKQTTETEIARQEAERALIKAQAEAQAQRLSGLAEAEVMRAKGYSEKDVIQADVQKAYAEGLGQMGANGGGSALGDIANLGVTLGAMGGVMGMTREAMSPMFNNGGGVTGGTAEPAKPAENTWNCSCGATNITSKCCPECGAKRPEPVQGWDCPACGCKNITSKFCPDCGAKKPEPPKPWDCPACGCKGITSKFCPDCGAKKPEPPATWDCKNCGQTGITSNFCPNCGAKKE